jgi:hypothetical protein
MAHEKSTRQVHDASIHKTPVCGKTTRESARAGQAAGNAGRCRPHTAPSASLERATTDAVRWARALLAQIEA